MQAGVKYQIMRTNPIQGGWAPGMQDIWNMMVSMQQSVAQMIEKFMEQQKQMYTQMRKIDTLKEANAQLTQKLHEQQGKTNKLAEKTKTQEEHVEEMRMAPQSWAQVLLKERKQGVIDANSHHTGPE